MCATQVSGLGVSKAVAGVEAELHVRVADCFGNKFNSEQQAFPYTFGLVLIPTDKMAGGFDKADKKVKQIKGSEKADGACKKGHTHTHTVPRSALH